MSTSAARHAVTFAAILAWALCWATKGDPVVAQCPPTENERETLVQMFSLADHHNLKPLTAMQASVRKSGDRVLTDNYDVALYTADNDRYRAQFVKNLPLDTQGFMAFGCGMSWSTGARVLFPYKALATYALAGDRTAIRKALLLEIDGAVAEYTTDEATLIASTYPDTSLTELSSATESQRHRVICFNLDDYYRKADFDRFLATKPTSSAEATLLNDLNSIHRGCLSRDYRHQLSSSVRRFGRERAVSNRVALRSSDFVSL